MNILGIETSCDETAAAVVRDGRTILSSVVASSLPDHQRYGGVIPEIASRKQLELITAVVDQALTKARVKLASITAIAVTQEPGLIGSLLVGLSYARALSFALRKPLIQVDHVQAHLYASFLSEKFSSRRQSPPTLPRLPAVGLIVSGGHTSLYLIKNFRKFSLLGQTRDDAAGEAFDKVARILGLGYPGGPVIDRLAKKGGTTKLRFNCALIPDSFDFSFSGVKTAVLYHIERQTQKTLPVEEIAAAFQSSVVNVLVKRAVEACQKTRVKTLVLGGGVAANSALRQELTREAAKHGIRVYLPPLSLCLDNAAMVAGLAYHRIKR